MFHYWRTLIHHKNNYFVNQENIVDCIDMVTTTKTLVFEDDNKKTSSVKVTSANASKALPLAITNATNVTTKNAQTKPIFSNNLTYYLKGSNGHGGGAKPVGNHRAVAKRT